MKQTLLFAFIALTFLCGCSKTQYYTHQVNYINGDAHTLSLRSIGLGTNRYKAIEDAELSAIETLLFRGIPASQQKDPLAALNENEALQKHKEYFDELLGNGRYKTFIISSIPVGEMSRHKGATRQMPVDVKINLRALRSDLEQHNIIRSFGY